MQNLKQKTKCEACENRAQSVLCSADTETMDLIDSTKFHQHYKAGQNLFYAGNQASGVYCILSGTIKLESPDENGKSQIVQVFKGGAMIGYRALFSEDTYLSSAVAAEETDVCFIPKATIMKLVSEKPALAMKFLIQLSNDFRMMETRLQRSNSHSAPERIAEALLFLRENFQDKSWTRKEIAEWAGTTTETVIRTLSEFEDEGLIDQKGRAIHILKRDKLLEKARITV